MGDNKGEKKTNKKEEAKDQLEVGRIVDLSAEERDAKLAILLEEA